MLKRENGRKILEIDNAECVVHACSCLENYLDRCVISYRDALPYEKKIGFGDQVFRSEFIKSIKQRQQLNLIDDQECCYCGHANKISLILPNSKKQFTCSKCNKEQFLYVIQLTNEFEETLTMQQSGGVAVLWTAVPKNHPEFENLLIKNRVQLASKLKLGNYREFSQIGAPWWHEYNQLTSCL